MEKISRFAKKVDWIAKFFQVLSFVWAFLIVYLLSYAFQYGQELQIQSDETL